MTKIAELCSSILGAFAACLLAIATASTCSIALADTPPANPLVACDYDSNRLACVGDSCVAPKPVCTFTNANQNACACAAKEWGTPPP